METNLTNSEWLELIYKHNVLKRLSNGEKFSSINLDLGFEPNSDALRKALGRLGFKKDKYQRLYYSKYNNEQQMAIKILNGIDVEETIEEIAADRYYRALINDFWDGETVTVEIDKEIYEEYIKLAEQFGCDLENEFMTMVLLEGLEMYKPIKRRKEHYLKYLNESGEFSKEEIEFIIKKEKEGYDLESLVLMSEDYELLNLTSEELKKICRRYSD